MKKEALLISNDATFIFMISTIADQLELNLIKLENSADILNEINTKKPFLVFWDFGESLNVERLNEKFYKFIPEDCHLLLFSNAITGLNHFKNGQLHIFEKPFSPNEISQFLKNIMH